VALRCTDDASPAADAFCADSWKIAGATSEQAMPLPEEPFALALDQALGVLYVGHLSSQEIGEVQGRVSTIDVCTTGKPRLTSITDRVFSNAGQGVTALTVTAPGDPRAPILATGRLNFSGTNNTAAEVLHLFVTGADGPCVPAAVPSARPLAVVPGKGFYSSALFPAGRDVRGILLSKDGSRAYLLHRNLPGGTSGSLTNPAAVVVLDRSLDASGRPADRAVDIVEVCSGPTEMRWHDAGLGPHLYVVCFESGQVYVIDPELTAVSAIINAGRGPTAISFSPTDPTLAFIAGFTDNNVSVVDLRPGSPTENRVVQRIGFPRVTSQ
jgi:YVTN family beta-propeller protein